MSDVVIENTSNSTQYFQFFTNPTIALQIFYIVGTVASILGVLYLIFRKYGIKIEENSFVSFFDADKGDYIQDREYQIKWGKSFKRPVRLPHKFNSGSKMDIWYKPTTGPMDKLTQEHFDPETKSNQTAINLSDKGFFRENELEKIRVRTITRLNHQKLDDLTNNIHVQVTDQRITIRNEN